MPSNYTRKRPYNKDGTPRKKYTLGNKPRKKYTRRKVKKIPLPVHEAFAYGKHIISYPNRTDQDVADILRPFLRYPMVPARFVNIHIPRPLSEMPNINTDMLTRKLDDRALRGVKCNLCEHTIAIYSWTNSRMPHKYQQFVPQPLQECLCKQTAVLVDSLGRPNVFADHEEFSYCTPIGKIWFSHSDLQEFRDIKPSLADTKPWVKLEGQRLDELADTLRISQLDLHAMPMIVPLLDTASIRENLRRYAYTYKIFILTKDYAYFPDGTIHREQNYTEKELRSLGLETKKYPRAILPYLQITSLRKLLVARYLGKPYVSTYQHKQLTKLRSNIAYIVRNVLLHTTNYKALRHALADHIPHKPLAIPPTEAYIHSFNPYLWSHGIHYTPPLRKPSRYLR